MKFKGCNVIRSLMVLGLALPLVMLTFNQCDDDNAEPEPDKNSVSYEKVNTSAACLKRFDSLDEGIVMSSKADYDSILNENPGPVASLCDTPKFTSSFDFSDQMVLAYSASTGGCDAESSINVTTKPGDTLKCELIMKPEGTCAQLLVRTIALTLPKKYASYEVQFIKTVK
jgi:hypothetical protein